jgi:hypothetical protein
MHPTSVAIVAVLAAGCGGAGAGASTQGTAAPPVPATGATGGALPALCGHLRVTVTGHVATPAATELSGLVASPDQPGVLWTHNDSGDRPRVFAIRADGRLLADLDVPGAEAVDWEDIALGPDPGAPGRHALYLGDIGDNQSSRAAIDVYRVPEPAVGDAPGTGTTAPAVRLRLRYPDGAHDAETLLVDPRTGELAVVTKQLSGESGVYVVPHPPVRGGERTLRLAARLHLGLGGMATAGDVSADGRVVAVRTYTGFVAWRKRPGASLAATVRRTPCHGRTSFPAERQGEALALDRHGTSFLTVPEGSSPAVRRYAATRR